MIENKSGTFCTQLAIASKCF